MLPLLVRTPLQGAASQRPTVRWSSRKHHAQARSQAPSTETATRRSGVSQPGHLHTGRGPGRASSYMAHREAQTQNVGGTAHVTDFIRVQAHRRGRFPSESATVTEAGSCWSVLKTALFLTKSEQTLSCSCPQEPAHRSGRVQRQDAASVLPRGSPQHRGQLSVLQYPLMSLEPKADHSRGHLGPTVVSCQHVRGEWT